MADSPATRAKRYRHHAAGIHDLCSADRCKAVRQAAQGADAPDEPIVITGGVGAAVERLFAALPVMDDYHAALAECARVAARVADTDEVRRVVALRELRAILAHWEQPAAAADSGAGPAAGGPAFAAAARGDRCGDRRGVRWLSSPPRGWLMTCSGCGVAWWWRAVGCRMTCWLRRWPSWPAWTIPSLRPNLILSASPRGPQAGPGRGQASPGLAACLAGGLVMDRGSRQSAVSPEGERS